MYLKYLPECIKIQELNDIISIAVNDSGMPIRFYYDSVIKLMYIYKDV